MTTKENDRQSKVAPLSPPSRLAAGLLSSIQSHSHDFSLPSFNPKAFLREKIAFVIHAKITVLKILL